MRIPLQKEVKRKGNTTQKYSLIQIKNTTWTMTDIAKKIQYLVTEGLSVCSISCNDLRQI